MGQRIAKCARSSAQQVGCAQALSNLLDSSTTPLRTKQDVEIMASYPYSGSRLTVSTVAIFALFRDRARGQQCVIWQDVCSSNQRLTTSLCAP
jgi:hypothetical protein